MTTTISLKKELHELIEGISDENLLKAIRLILTFRKGADKASRQSDIDSSPGFPVSKLTLPNGEQICVTPGNSSIESSELFGIWKDQPITAEELRKQAWGGRL